MSQDQFAQYVSALKTAIDAGEAFLLLLPPYSLQLAFVDQHTTKARFIESGFKDGDTGDLADRVTALLLGLLSGTDPETIKNQPVFANDAVETVTQDIKVVRQTLYTERLQRRYDLKRSSKAPAFSSVDWDVKIKVQDAQVKTDKTPYATVRLKYQRDFGGDMYAIFGGRTFDSVQVNFAAEEIDYLIKVLQRIGGALNSLDESRKE